MGRIIDGLVQEKLSRLWWQFSTHRRVFHLSDIGANRDVYIAIKRDIVRTEIDKFDHSIYHPLTRVPKGHNLSYIYYSDSSSYVQNRFNNILKAIFIIH